MSSPFTSSSSSLDTRSNPEPRSHPRQARTPISNNGSPTGIGTLGSRLIAWFLGVRAPELLNPGALRRAIHQRVLRSRLVWTFFILATVAILILLLFVVGIGIGANWANVPAIDTELPAKSRALTSQADALLVPAIVDADNMFVGMPSAARISAKRPDRALARPLAIRDIPDGYKRVIQALEQNSLNSYRSNAFGADWISSALSAATLGHRGGASSIPQQYARVVLGLGNSHESAREILSRKWTEATYGGAHVLALKRTFGARWMDKMIAEYAEVQPIASSPEVAGLYAGSEIFFGKKPASLTDAQAAVLAAMAQRPVVLRVLTGGRYGLSVAAETFVRRRASYGIAKAFARDNARKNAALQALNAMPLIAPVLPAIYARTTTDKGTLVQPARRAMRVAPSETVAALNELASVSPPDGLSQLTLSVSTADNLSFKDRFVAALQKIDAAGNLGVRLLPSPTLGKAPADVVAVEVDRSGWVKRLYSTTEYLPLDRRLELASSAKIIAALALPGRCALNPSTLAGVFARSHPTELEPYLKACTSQKQLADLMGRFHFEAETPNLAHAISYGMVTATPREAIAAYAAVNDRIHGGAGDVAEARVLQSAYRTEGPDLALPRPRYHLGSDIVGAQTIALARIVLKAAALPGGTVGGLAAKCPALTLAKTGTLGGNGNDGNRARMLAGGFNDGSTFFIFVSARDGGLIGNLSGQDLILLALPFCKRGLPHA